MHYHPALVLHKLWYYEYSQGRSRDKRWPFRCNNDTTNKSQSLCTAIQLRYNTSYNFFMCIHKEEKLRLHNLKMPLGAQNDKCLILSFLWFGLCRKFFARCMHKENLRCSNGQKASWIKSKQHIQFFISKNRCSFALHLFIMFVFYFWNPWRSCTSQTYERIPFPI